MDFLVIRLPILVGYVVQDLLDGRRQIQSAGGNLDIMLNTFDTSIREDIPALVKGTLPQQRVTKLSPIPAGKQELSKLLQDAMSY